MNAEHLRMLWQATLALSAALAVVLLLRATLRRYIGAQAAYALWLLPPVSLLAGLLPAPTQLVPMPMLRVDSLLAPAAARMADNAASSPLDTAQWLLPLWLLGASLCAIALWQQQRRFVRALGKVRPLARGLWQAEQGEGCPAVIGVLPPRLVLPSDFESRYAADERALILAHERAHLARGDAFANALAALLRGLFWFHPLLHYAIARFRQDQELACDATVLRRHPQSRRAYADAMLKTQLAVLGLPVGCHWQSSHPLKERIAMLKHPLPNPVRHALGLGFAAALTLCGGYAAWAAQPAQMRPQAAASAAKQKVLAIFQQRVDSGAAHTFKMINPIGEPFAFRNDDGAKWEGEFVVTDAGGGKWQLAGTLKRDGKLMSEPKVIVADGVEARILVGKADGEHLEGLDLKVTLTADAAAIGGEPATQVADAGTAVAWAGQATTLPPPLSPTAASATDRPALELDGVRLAKPPQYPAAAIKQRIEGKVVLRVLVDEDGVPKQVEVHSAKAFSRKPSDSADAADGPRDIADPTMLIDASKSVVWDWRFDPAQHAGKPAQDWLQVPFTFSLRDD